MKKGRLKIATCQFAVGVHAELKNRASWMWQCLSARLMWIILVMLFVFGL